MTGLSIGHPFPFWHLFKLSDLELIIKTLAGLEEVLAQELRDLGAADPQPGKRVVTVNGDERLLYRANLHLRTALRVLVPVASFPARNEDELYEAVRGIDWSRYLGPDNTIAVNTNTQSAQLSHSHFLSLRTKDAVCDFFRDRSGRRPSVDTERPDLRLHLHIDSLNECTLSLDSSGEGLHRRGYRKGVGLAPLNEVLAAGLLQLAGYDGEVAFVDPLCGSGTLPIEAAMLSTRTPPGMYRSFGFEKWTQFKPSLYAEIQEEARDNIRRAPAPIVGGDVDGRVIRKAHENIEAAGFDRLIRVFKGSFQYLRPPDPPGILITNPPYELRLKTSDIEGMYKTLGDTFKQNFAGYTAWVLSGNIAALKRVGLRPSRKLHLFNGPVEVRFHRFDLYSGSRKTGRSEEEE